MVASGNIEHESTSRATPSWIVVASQELSALWRGGRIPALLVPFSIVLRGRANRRVAYVTSGSQKAVQPPLELPCVKSCAPIGASS